MLQKLLYSRHLHQKLLMGLLLNTYRWEVTPLEISRVRSSYFENELIFPKGSVQFNNALLMKNIAHEWSSVTDKPCYQ